MERNTYIYFFTFFLLALSCQHFESSNTKPLNIVLFLVDDLGWQDTSVPFWTKKMPLNQKYHTPNMERLAKEIHKESGKKVAWPI